ncbi:MAG: hypothetical protein ACMUJM_22155 [bacterium]
MPVSLNTDNLTFIDFPQQIALQKYEQNIQEFVKYFRTHPTVSAIYQIGGINDPGISDLDLVLVLKENEALSSKDNDFLTTLNQYLFIHPPFIISEDLFVYLPYFFYANNIRKLTGKNYQFLEPELSLDNLQLCALLCYEAAIGRLSDIIYQTTCGNSISLRKMLLKLNSIKHNISLMNKVIDTCEGNGWDKFIIQIGSLRRSWFSLSKDEQIKNTYSALYEGVNVLLEIINNLALRSKNLFRIDNICNEHPEAYYIYPNSLQIIKYNGDSKSSISTVRNPFFFLKKLRFKAQKKIARHVNDLSIITLPKELILLLLLIGTKDNLFVRNQKYFSCVSKHNVPAVIKLRVDLLNKYNEFISAHKDLHMSYLTMGSSLEKKAKFYTIKKCLLKSLIKYQVV